MTAPTNSPSTTQSSQVEKFARSMLQANGHHGSDLEEAVQKSLIVLQRLKGHQNDFIELGASYPDSRLLALTQDLSFVKNGCENPNCKTTPDKLLFVSGLKKCARCKAALYCSKECQKTDWKAHKVTCKAPVEEKHI